MGTTTFICYGNMMMTKPIWTDAQIIKQLNSGERWSGSVITYAFLEYRQQIALDQGEGKGFSPFTTAQRQLTELSLAVWDDLITPGIKLGDIKKSDIEFGNTTTGIDYAHAYYPDLGTVWLNSNYPDLKKPVFGSYDAQTYIHEIGHALGLEHMGNYNGDYGDGPSSYQDSSVYSVMSYYGPNENSGKNEVAWANWVGTDGKRYSPQTPMINDIMTIQHMYGAAASRADDSVYGFNSTVTGPMAAIYDFSLNKNPVLAIYDGGGNDTLNLSGWSTNSNIDLRPGHFSSVNGMENNLSIARGVIIENAITGAGNDTIWLNSADNFLNGGAGYDTVVFGGSYFSYDLSYNPVNTYYHALDTQGQEGTNVLVNIEAAIFSDQSGVLAELTSGVHRFYNTDANTHFFTANNKEATATIHQDHMSYEGVQFARNVFDTANSIDVHHFYNPTTEGHLFTANTNEVASILANNLGLHYEGLAYTAYNQKTAKSTELYRFYNVETNSHFYTSDVVEMNHVKINFAGQYVYEGVAFYVGVA